MRPEEFIQLIRIDAEILSAQTNLPVAGLIAVPALETGWGALLQQGEVYTHNLFNLKGTGPAGVVWINSPEWYTLETWDQLKSTGKCFTLTGESAHSLYEGYIRQAFRAYASFSDSYTDFYQVLKAKPRYTPVLRARDPYWFCNALQISGFATDPKYAEKLHTILRRRVIPGL